jgi:hypothetical protein
MTLTPPSSGFSTEPQPDDVLVDEKMPRTHRVRVKVFRWSIAACADECKAICKRGSKIPYLFSLFSVAAVAAASCAVQIYIYKHTKPRPGGPKVLGMWELGLATFGLAAVILFFWWLTSRRTDAADMDSLERKIRDLDYTSEEVDDE